MPDITYHKGDIVLVEELHVAIKISDSLFLFPPVDHNSGNLPFIRTEVPEEKLFPLSRSSVNKFSDQDKRIIATALCTIGADTSWIKINNSGLRDKHT